MSRARGPSGLWLEFKVEIGLWQRLGCPFGFRPAGGCGVEIRAAGQARQRGLGLRALDGLGLLPFLVRRLKSSCGGQGGGGQDSGQGRRWSTEREWWLANGSSRGAVHIGRQQGRWVQVRWVEAGRTGMEDGPGGVRHDPV